jgi:hypothetical protein
MIYSFFLSSTRRRLHSTRGVSQYFITGWRTGNFLPVRAFFVSSVCGILPSEILEKLTNLD